MKMNLFLCPIDIYKHDILHGADLLISDSSHYAIALKYDESIHEAPIVVAKAVNEIACEFEAEARKKEVMILQNPGLACELFSVVPVLGMEIPEALYELIAEAYAYTYKVQNKLP